jgi:hypothetical protein
MWRKDRELLIPPYAENDYKEGILAKISKMQDMSRISTMFFQSN